MAAGEFENITPTTQQAAASTLHAGGSPVLHAPRLRVCAVVFPVFAVATLLWGYSAPARASDDSLAEYKQWSDRLAAAGKRHDAADELLCITTIGERWSWALNTLPQRLIEQAVRESELAQLGPARMEVLQILYDLRWRHSDGSEPSRWWLHLSLNLLEHNQRAEALAVAAHITDPYALIAVQVDNRYKGIAKSEFVERDILKAAKKELERRQAAARQAPRDLSRIVQVAWGLIRLRRYDDVLQLTDPVLQGKQAATPESAPYEDLQQEFPWVLEARAIALTALGRYDEAVVVVRLACQQSKDDLVSHSLDLASLLAALNRPQEALAAIPPLERASVYGRAVAAKVQVMIASELGDAAGLAAALADLRAHAQDYPLIREAALIIAGKEDEAVATLLARLADPALRADALVELQDYAERPAPAITSAWRERQKALRDRPEVRQAVAAYGRIRSYELPGVMF
jgi:hypothetical protein